MTPRAFLTTLTCFVLGWGVLLFVAGVVVKGCR